MIKHLLGILALIFCISAHADAPSDSTLDELLQLTHQQEQVLGAYRAVLDAYATARLNVATQDPLLTDKQRQKLGRIKTMTAEIASRLVSWDAIRPAVLELYRNKLSQDQVTQVLAMLKSPVWKIYSETVAPVQAEAVNGAVQIAIRMYPLIDAEVSREIADALYKEKSKS